ncbi:MAG TPA: hypothetical protein DCE42_07435 [Myxococcales bacterium]|nr:hypothetical protein [Myxococcales bacterium]
MLSILKSEWSEKYGQVKSAAEKYGVIVVPFSHLPHDRLVITKEENCKEFFVLFEREGRTFLVLRLDDTYQVFLDKINFKWFFREWLSGVSLQTLILESEEKGFVERCERWSLLEGSRRDKNYRRKGWEEFPLDEWQSMESRFENELHFDNWKFSITVPHVEVSLAKMRTEDIVYNLAVEADFLIKYQLALQSVLKPGEPIYLVRWGVSVWILDIHKKPLDAFSTSWRGSPLSVDIMTGTRDEPVYMFTPDFRLGLLNDFETPMITLFGEELIRTLKSQQPVLLESQGD